VKPVLQRKADAQGQPHQVSSITPICGYFPCPFSNSTLSSFAIITCSGLRRSHHARACARARRALR
jgi:hypothetical protein